MKYEYTANTDHGVPIKSWTRGVPVEESAKQQLKNIASLPFMFKHVAVMPDVHLGNGATVGSVLATKGAIIPAAVGVDIGCGIMAVRTSLVANDLPDNLFAIRSAIEKAVPHGRTDNGGPNDRGAWNETPEDTVRTFVIGHLGQLKSIVTKHPKLERAASKAVKHIGTLGTGNHFIELCLDEQQQVWIMLHSGSRGIGNAIGQYFIEQAKKEMERYYINLPDKDLAYFPQGSTGFSDYFDALHWAQNFALFNREAMMMAVIAALQSELPNTFTITEQAVNCHHNYAQWENHFGENVILTRKGAVNASLGQLGIIPGSMGARSFIVRGKGNPDSFNSCSHGAGRKMSRTEARRTFTLVDHERDTQGVECRKDESVIDETPKAYKDIQAVMDAQSDLVDIVHSLKQVLCVKGASDGH